MRGFEGNGCILADDMGLGKTLQVRWGPCSSPHPTASASLLSWLPDAFLQLSSHFNPEIMR
jgi:SNF2 family DNA or RNA helicase